MFGRPIWWVVKHTIISSFQSKVDQLGRNTIRIAQHNQTPIQNANTFIDFTYSCISISIYVYNMHLCNFFSLPLYDSSIDNLCQFISHFYPISDQFLLLHSILRHVSCCIGVGICVMHDCSK